MANADTKDFYTHDFPQPDRAEVIATATQDPEIGPKVELDATQAHELATMMRGLTWLSPTPSCDKPMYQLKLFTGHKLILAVAICFYCGCYQPLHSDLHDSDGPKSFDTRTPEAKALAAFLAKLFAPGK